MTVLALLLYVVGLLLAFGWRALAQWRATGDAGFRGISDRPGSPGWWGGVLFAVALVLGGAAPVLALTGAVTPWERLSHPAAGVAGLVTAVAGLLALLAAQRAMGASWRVGVDPAERTALVTAGLFARVRNPIYTAMVVFAAGTALMVPSAVAALAVAALVTAVSVHVRYVEEPYLRAVHGDAYDRYAAASGRFLPRLRPRRRSRPGGRQRPPRTSA
jgi:protein-S-isoprenylcysteine O-methyltransferase Ste14